MRRTLLTAALLTLTLSSALQAQYGGYRSPGRGGYGYGYPGRYPEYRHLDRVAAIAHDIDLTARSIYRQAAYNNRRPDRYEARMLEDLYRLYGRAARFHDVVEGYRGNPRATADEFVALEDSFYRLGQTLQTVEPRSYIDRGMERIYVLMTDLSRYYGREGYGRWGRYGYDRDGRRDRYDDRYDRYDGRYDGRPRR